MLPLAGRIGLGHETAKVEAIEHVAPGFGCGKVARTQSPKPSRPGMVSTRAPISASSRAASRSFSMASRRCSNSTSALTTPVTPGLPSRSPPIHEPNDSQRRGAFTVG